MPAHSDYQTQNEAEPRDSSVNKSHRSVRGHDGAWDAPPLLWSEAEAGVPHCHAGRSTKGRAAARPLHSALPMERFPEPLQTRENFGRSTSARADRCRSRTRGSGHIHLLHHSPSPPSLPSRAASPSRSRRDTGGSGGRHGRREGALPPALPARRAWLTAPSASRKQPWASSSSSRVPALVLSHSPGNHFSASRLRTTLVRSGAAAVLVPPAGSSQSRQRRQRARSSLRRQRRQ